MISTARTFRQMTAALTAFALLSPALAARADETQTGATSVGIAQPAPTAAPVDKVLAPVYGDLSHLTFTATGPLSAELVSPADGSRAPSISTAFEVSTVRDGGVELSVNGKIVPLSRIGRRSVNNRTGETHYTYYGVPLEEGPNRIVLVPLGANGLRGNPVVANVIGPGPAVRIDTSFEGKPVADGKTPILVHLAGFDRTGLSAASGGLVRLTIVRGDAHFLGRRYDAQPSAPPLSAAPDVPTAVPSAQSAAGIAVPQNTTTPFPVGPDGLGSSPGPQIGESNAFHAIGDGDTPLQSIDVSLGMGGVATLQLMPGLQAGDLHIRTDFGGSASESVIFIASAVRKPMVLGLATTGVGSVPGVPGESVTEEDGVNSRRGRIAIYGVGQVARNAQVQVAYDTANSLDETTQYGGNTDDPQDRAYQTFGDASTRRDDALSRDHLYARFDDGHDSAMWGEFQANTAGASGDGFSQLVSGAKVEAGGSNVKASVFNAHNDVAYSRQVFSPTGLATIGALLHPQIVVGSDTISVVTLDRRTGAILGQTLLARNVDYTLDYGTGQLHFINPPLPFDLNFNPQQILCEYEYDGMGASAQTTGGRVDAGIGGSQAVRIGAGYVNDSTGAGNFTLFGQDLSGKLAGGGWTVSHDMAQGSLTSIDSTGTTSTLNNGVTEGNAYRATFSDAFGPNHFDANFDSTSAGYSNPFGGLSTAGLLDYRVAYQRLIGKAGDSVTVSFDHEQNNLDGGISSSSNASVLAQAHVTKRVKVRAGINAISSSGSTTATNTALADQISSVPTPIAVATTGPAAVNQSSGTTTQVDVGAEYKVAPQVDVSVDRITSLGGPEQSSQPSQTTAQLAVDLPNKGRAYVRQLWSDSPTQSFAAATSSLTSESGSTRSTAVGLEQAVGSNTSVDTEYSIDNTASGSDVYSSIGGREHFNLGKNLHGDATLQHAASIGSDGGSFNLYGLSLAYATSTRFRATTQYQLRTGYSPGYTLSVGAAGALSTNVAAFVSSNTASTGTYDTVDDKVSFAYRPAQNDRAVTLAGFEAEDGNLSEIGTHTQLLSLEELYRPDCLTEIAGRYAYKLDGDSYYPAHSSLFGLRLTRKLTHRFDVAGEVRYLSAHGIAGDSTTGYAVEAGYRVGDEMRFAAGYNFSGSPDPSLAIAPTRRGVYATATSVIDRIFGWGKDDF